MTQKSKRQQQREQFKKQRARQRLLNNVIIAAVVVAALGIFVAMFRDTNRADIGEAILAEGEVNHVDPGTDVEYNSNPPTSGSHYDQPMNAGFYEDGSIETQVPFPESHIVHSLEHGYVVIWYNCDVLETAAACDELKDQVRTVMDRYNNLKIIAFP
ncbi:MAG: DUF3105 domain-containing protein, partial [Anaerolineae bacterium]|nr:DUF3105 domain-containing protein [Anaerolineae bacterium]